MPDNVEVVVSTRIDQIQPQNVPLDLVINPDDTEEALRTLLQHMKQTLIKLNELNLRIRKLESRFQ